MFLGYGFGRDVYAVSEEFSTEARQSYQHACTYILRYKHTLSILTEVMDFISTNMYIHTYIHTSSKLPQQENTYTHYLSHLNTELAHPDDRTKLLAPAPVGRKCRHPLCGVAAESSAPACAARSCVRRALRKGTATRALQRIPHVHCTYSCVHFLGLHF